VPETKLKPGSKTATSFEFTFEEMMLALKHIMEMSLETMQMLPGGPDTIFNKPE
jgi:hypothetical protein